MCVCVCVMETCHVARLNLIPNARQAIMPGSMQHCCKHVHMRQQHEQLKAMSRLQRGGRHLLQQSRRRVRREDQVVSGEWILGQECYEGWNDECELLAVHCNLTLLLSGLLRKHSYHTISVSLYQVFTIACRPECSQLIFFLRVHRSGICTLDFHTPGMRNLGHDPRTK